MEFTYQPADFRYKDWELHGQPYSKIADYFNSFNDFPTGPQSPFLWIIVGVIGVVILVFASVCWVTRCRKSNSGYQPIPSHPNVATNTPRNTNVTRTNVPRRNPTLTTQQPTNPSQTNTNSRPGTKLNNVAGQKAVTDSKN